jgi:hypothetical protein
MLPYIRFNCEGLNPLFLLLFNEYLLDNITNSILCILPQLFCICLVV